MRVRGGRGGASRGSPHLVVLGGEFCSTVEQGVAQPGGDGVSPGGVAFIFGTCRVTAVVTAVAAQSQTISTSATMEKSDRLVLE